jgi:hypothetical protein
MNKIRNIAGVLLFALLLTAVPLLKAGTNSVGLGWSANPPADNVVAYIVVQGTASRVYNVTNNVGTNLTATMTNLDRGQTYYWSVFARNDVGLDSDLSEEVWLTITPSNSIVRTLAATNYTRTNVTLVGVVSNIPGAFSASFEYTQGTNWGTNASTFTAAQWFTNTDNVNVTFDIPVVPTNYVYRLVVTNGPYVYIGKNVQFRTIPPATPTHIEFKTTILQTASLGGTNVIWEEVMTASVVKEYPTNGVGFFKSRMDYAYVTNGYIPDLSIPMPDPPGEVTADAGSGGGGQAEPVSLQFRTKSAMPPPAPN